MVHCHQQRSRQVDGRPARRDEALVRIINKQKRRAKIEMKIWRYLAWFVISLVVVGAWYIVERWI